MNHPHQIDLDSGRRLSLMELKQFLTDEGLLEGLPTAERNRQRVERWVLEHRGRPYPGEPHLIRPVETPVPYQGDRPYRFGTPSALPSVTCMGRFTSLDPARDPVREYSGLVVLWFQEEFALPIDPAILRQIRSLDWETLAADLDY